MGDIKEFSVTKEKKFFFGGEGNVDVRDLVDTKIGGWEKVKNFDGGGKVGDSSLSLLPKKSTSDFEIGVENVLKVTILLLLFPTQHLSKALK